MECNKAQELLILFLFNNVNKIKKFTIGEQIFIKVPSSGKNKNNYRYGNSLDLKFGFLIDL